ncbi:MAG: polysaccharide deacetylase family protein [Kiritimatiellia bacterium]
MGVPAHISIHDVAPDTLEPVRNMIDTLRGIGVDRVMLLVIPGGTWTPEGIDQLRTWFGEGHLPAGHGWTHRVEHRKTLWHKLHGVLISRYVAEHLALDREQIVELIRRNHAWFGQQGLPSPTHYVPPAWAMGTVSRRDLDGLPFDTYETLTGVYDRRRRQFIRSPLMGFQADTRFRAAALTVSNVWNRKVSRGGMPLRLALHPHDLQLRLRDDLLRWCAELDTRPEMET